MVLRKLRFAAAATAGILLLGGCLAGPDFKRPAAPEDGKYTEKPLPEKTAAAAGAAQRFVSGRDIPAQWWKLFHSPALDGLVRQALKENPSLAAAKASLRKSREDALAQTGVLFPKVDAAFSPERQKISGAAFGQPNLNISPFTLYNASVNVSYALDFAGALRRGLESLHSQVERQRYLLKGVHLALTANVATAAFKEASLRAQIAATKEILAALEKQLAVIEEQFRLGAVAQTDVLAQRAQLAQAQATLPPLEKDLGLTRHQLATLTGKLPGEAKLPVFELDGIRLPEELPVSLPSALARQRPDILAAEEALHSASAGIGLATANLYPQITLNANVGSVTTQLAGLFGPGTGIWSLGGSLMQPLFHGGELTAKRRAAIAGFDQAAAQYRDTVLQAFQNVADALRALDADAETLKAQAEAASAAKDSLDLARSQYELGAASYLALLNAERQYQQTRIGLVQAQAARFADTAALFQALGGGWWNESPATAELNGETRSAQ